jgi:alkylated DNA repair dioxygenase AlkB
VSVRAQSAVPRRPRVRVPAGLAYDASFVAPHERDALVAWLQTLHPIWEDRFTARQAATLGGQRRLLRPVYWLGNWQFACLDYYRPPHGVHDRCVRAEPFPPVLAGMVERIEQRTRAMFRAPDLPARWHLNTCLINLYGSALADGKAVDTARVGEHRDFEPGPVASISLGERALFQFVTRGRRGAPSSVAYQQWLDDGSLLIFGGDTWKDRTLHRVQRVDRKLGARFACGRRLRHPPRQLHLALRARRARRAVRRARASSTRRRPRLRRSARRPLPFLPVRARRRARGLTTAARASRGAAVRPDARRANDPACEPRQLATPSAAHSARATRMPSSAALTMPPA